MNTNSPTPMHPYPRTHPHHNRKETVEEVEVVAVVAMVILSARGTSRRLGPRRCKRCGTGRLSSSLATWAGKPRRPRKFPSSWNG